MFPPLIKKRVPLFHGNSFVVDFEIFGSAEEANVLNNMCLETSL